MEIIELDRMRKAFSPANQRYKHPYEESAELRYLWTYGRTDEHETMRFYGLAVKCVKDAQIDDALANIKKGLKLDPRCHQLFALRADIFMQQSKWTEAIRQYELARHSKDDDGVSYRDQLAAAYWKRGNWYRQRGGSLMNAAIDYEQVLAVGGGHVPLIEAQDILLRTLRILGRYEAYRFHWSKFVKRGTPARISDLLSRYASYKIDRRELASARHILFKALDLDKRNVQAQNLLQVVYGMGHSMAACTVIWCMHDCYEKALLTIEKCRDCDPYNPGYTLLKTIVLRLSGKTAEAAKWLKSVDRGFYKLLEPSQDKRGSIMGTLGIDETRTRLVEQWHLIRYEVAARYTVEGRYEEARRIIQQSEATDSLPEMDVLLGDGYLSQAAPIDAIIFYLRAWEKCRLRNDWNDSPKRIQLIQRIIAILSDSTDEITDETTREQTLRILEQESELPMRIRERIAILSGIKTADPVNFIQLVTTFIYRNKLYDCRANW